MPIPEIFKSDTFWAAFSALVAFAALSGTVGGAVLAIFRAGRWRRLQAALDKERKFYEEQARRVTPEPIRLPEESAIDRYATSIRSGLLALTQLTGEQRDKVKDKVRALLSQLRATHATLVEALKPFTTNSARKFFDDFDSFNQHYGNRHEPLSAPSEEPKMENIRLQNFRIRYQEKGFSEKLISLVAINCTYS